MNLALWLAEEAPEAVPSMLQQIKDWGEFISVIILIVATVGLWWATAQVHHDEVNKLGDHLADANDNMTDVALAEIDSHHRYADRMRKLADVRRLRRKSISDKAKP